MRTFLPQLFPLVAMSRLMSASRKAFSESVFQTCIKTGGCKELAVKNLTVKMNNIAKKIMFVIS